MAKILVIDDDENILNLAERRLRMRGHSVITTGDSRGASVLIRKSRPDLVLLDEGLPSLAGHSLAVLLKSLKVEAKIVLFSNFPEREVSRLALECGAQGYILKVEGMGHMVDEVERFLDEEE